MGTQKAFLLASCKLELESEWKKAQPVQVPKGTVGQAAGTALKGRAHWSRMQGQKPWPPCVQATHTSGQGRPTCPHLFQVSCNHRKRTGSMQGRLLYEQVCRECSEMLLRLQEIHTRDKAGCYKRERIRSNLGFSRVEKCKEKRSEILK